MKEALLEQNASDERGIDVVRNKIKMFAQKKVTMPQSRHKIILLDEADSMTPAAQQALRRIMEIYSSTTRFCLVCNLSSKIIEPIQSRCAIIRYSKIEDKEMLKRLLKICELEGLNGKYSMDGLEALIFVSDGDMRQAINGLQSCFAGFGFVNAENVFKVCDQPHPLKIRSIYQHCLKGDVGQALDELQVLYDMGYSSLDIITTFFRVAKTMKEIDEAKRLEWIKVRFIEFE
jgi:replication factor C subunit 2/4